MAEPKENVWCMIELIFATNNSNKAKEINSITGNTIKVLTMSEAGLNIDIPEPYETLQQNASAKSKTIYGILQKNCFSEDTGLEVDALNGEPGAKSARYAGDDKNNEANIELLLYNLQNIKNRAARFKTVISLIWSNEEYFFEGIAEGMITKERKGTNGFGYDAVFMPGGSGKTFAEMGMNEKNKFSHRKKAMDKLIEFLKRLA